MSTLTATPDTLRSLVRLDVDFTDMLIQPDAYAIVRARPDTGAVQQIRQNPVAAPLTAVYQQLNSNADFELGIANWAAIAATGTVPTLSASSGAGHVNRGSSGLQLVTAVTSNTGPAAESEKCPVIPGQVYAVSAWIATATAAYLPSVGINWYDASSNKLGTTLNQAVVAAPGAAAVVQPTAGQPASTNGYGWIAPAGAAFATVVVGFLSEASFAGALTFYFDEVRLLQLVSIVKGTITPAVPTTDTDLTVPTALNRLTSGQGVAYDHEMPLDVPVSYTATAYVINGSWAIMLGGQNIEANSRFEPPANITGWSSLGNTTLAASSTQAHSGTQSLRITPDGVTANSGAYGEQEAATALLWYGYQGWIWMTTGVAFQFGVEFDGPSGAFMGQSTNNQTPGTGTWTKFMGIGQAVTATALVRAVAKFAGTGAAANLVYVDDVFLWSPTTVPATATSATVVVAGTGAVWLKDPLAPGKSLQITGPRRIYNGWGFQTSSRGIGLLSSPDEVRKAFAGVQDVNNRPNPMAQVRVRGGVVATLRLMPHSFADRDALRDLLSPGTQLLFQAPAQYGIPDRYLLFGDESVAILGDDIRHQVRLASLPYQVVDAPGGPAQAPQGYRWRDASRAYASWGAVMASGGGTYDSYRRTVAAGALGTPDVAPGAYTLLGTAANFSVAVGAAQVALTAAAAPQIAYLGSYGDFSALQLTFTAPAVAVGSFYQLGVVFRVQNSTNYYRWVLEFGTASTVISRWIKTLAGVDTTINSGTAVSYVAGQTFRVQVLIAGSTLTGWWWNPTTGARVDGSPDQAALADGAPGVLVNPGGIGLYANRNTGNTNSGLVPTFDDLVLATGPTWQQVADGALA